MNNEKKKKSTSFSSPPLRGSGRGYLLALWKRLKEVFFYLARVRTLGGLGSRPFKLLNTFLVQLGALRNHHKVLAFFALVFLIGGGFFLFSNTQSAFAEWWNDGWLYRKEIAITNSSTAQTNTQVKIISGTDLSALVTAGKLQSDLDDLRFTDINGNVVEYWIEDSTNTSVDVWGLLPSVPTSGTTVYMYYGNASAEAGKSTVGSSDYPGVSCQAILLSGVTIDGTYYIDPTAQETSDKFQAYCDLTNDDGGWTMIMKTQADTTTFHYDSGYWTSSNTYQADDVNTSVGDSKFSSFNTLQFSSLRGCVSSPDTNCLIREFDPAKDSALSLFSEAESSPCTCGNDGGTLTFSEGNPNAV